VSLAALAEIATAAGVILVAVQLWIGRHQTRTALEDALSKEYREIALALPPAAFYDPPTGKPIEAFDDHLREYLWYVDLSNQQVFLRQQCRVSRRTWRLWRDGIRDNLARPAFRNAWTQLSTHMARSFHELRRLEEDWDADPAWWDPPWWRRPFGGKLGRLPSATTRTSAPNV
jgi:hypothetical protein